MGSPQMHSRHEPHHAQYQRHARYQDDALQVVFGQAQGIGVAVERSELLRQVFADVLIGCRQGAI